MEVIARKLARLSISRARFFFISVQKMNRKRKLGYYQFGGMMIPFGYQTHGITSPTLLGGGGRRTECPSGGRTPASVTAPLSRQIHDLEDEVGTKLLGRKPEPGCVSLKQAGPS
jgi:hypothetical protein